MNIPGIILSVLFLASVFGASAQSISRHKPKVTRVLFVYDASGSMLADWEGESRYEISKNLLFRIVDSIEVSNPNVEFGLRIFGHQSGHAAKNCQDSKLEVFFGKRNSSKIKQTLNGIQPQGWTPIAYSLFNAASDFPDDTSAHNIIILITDGLETCNGDPCATAEALQRKRIILKPFIVGIGLEEKDKKAFDCIGIYFDGANKENLKKALNVAVSQALNTTSSQINLLNLKGDPVYTNIEVSFYDSYSQKLLYNFVHSKSGTGRPDTLYLDPAGKYDMVVHTNPQVVKRNIELIPGKHNVIAVETPQTDLFLRISGHAGATGIQGIIRKKDAPGIMSLQDFNTTERYLAGAYDIDILTLPRKKYHNVQFKEGEALEIAVPNDGTATFMAYDAFLLTIFNIENGEWVKIYEYKPIKNREVLSLQPGDYQIVYRPLAAKKAAASKVQLLQIRSGINTVLRL